MERDDSRMEVLLALAIGSRRKGRERRMLPDRRSGVDRRKAHVAVATERRVIGERRRVVRRRVDQDEGATLLQKARSRLSGRSRARGESQGSRDGLR